MQFCFPLTNMFMQFCFPLTNNEWSQIAWFDARCSEHVTSNVTCVHSQRNTKDIVFRLAQMTLCLIMLSNLLHCVEPNIISTIPTNWFLIRQMHIPCVMSTLLWCYKVWWILFVVTQVSFLMVLYFFFGSFFLALYTM